ncbi:MAG: hydrolase [Pseudomonadota bacterium]
MTSTRERLRPETYALVLNDFQPAMYQGVQSHDRLTVMHNVQALARASRVFGLPTVVTTVAKDSISGPFMAEVTELFPGLEILDRTSINASLEGQFRAAIEATGRKKIILAGLWTSACMTFLSLDMLAEGYEVYVPTDACGDTSTEAHQRAVSRLEAAGMVPMTAFQTVFELQQDWARSATYGGVMDITHRHSPYGIQVGFSKRALGEHASEAGTQAA